MENLNLFHENTTENFIENIDVLQNDKNDDDNNILNVEVSIKKTQKRKTEKTKPPPPPLPECTICCEPYNKSLRTPIICSYEDCHYQACKTCIRTYLISTTQEPHCMKCKKPFDDSFMFKNLNKSYYKTGFKEHRRKILFDIEISKIPETIPAVEHYLQVEELQEKNNKINKEIVQLETEIRNRRILLNENYRSIRILQGNGAKPEDKRKFIMPCQNEECRGFLSTAYKCEICKYFTCPHCLELIGTDKNTTEHVCNPDCIQNAEAIKKDTRACPSCGTRIYKIEGCSQIWCTSCHVAFDWNTGKVDNGTIHNPHFFEWQRTGGNVRIEQANIEGNGCGNGANIRGRVWVNYRTNIISYLEKWQQNFRHYEIDIYNTNNNTDTEFYKNNKDTFLKKLREIRQLLNGFNKLTRIIEHIANVIAFEARAKIDNLDNHNMMRILYILKRVTPEDFADTIYKNSIQKKKLIDKYHIYELIITVGRELFNTFAIDELYLKISNEISFMRTFIEIDKNVTQLLIQYKQKDTEIMEFIKYCNEQFQRIGLLYNERIHGFYINDGENKYDWGTLKTLPVSNDKNDKHNPYLKPETHDKN